MPRLFAYPSRLFVITALFAALPADAGDCGFAGLRFDSHPTSTVYRKRNPQNEEELAKANLEILSKLAKGESSSIWAEIFSGRHQADMLQTLGAGKNRKLLERLGFKTNSFINGVLDSDKGKTALYRKLITEKSEKSDLLLDSLRGVSRPGTEKSAAALKEVLAEAGLKGSLLNPSLSNEELRAIFNDTKILQNYLHELPGIADAIIAHEAGVITTGQFKTQVAANLFHNGPNKGFWEILGSSWVTTALRKSSHPKAKTFFAGTVLEGEVRSGVITPSYPGPISFEGVFHTILDRLSGATRGGVTKFFEEIPAEAHPVSTFSDILTVNQNQVLYQYNALRTRISELASNGRVTQDQAKLLTDFTRQAEQRVKKLQAYLEQAMKISTEGKVQIISLKLRDGSVRAFRSTDSGPQIRKAISDRVQALLKEEEALNGQPLKMEISWAEPNAARFAS